MPRNDQTASLNARMVNLAFNQTQTFDCPHDYIHDCHKLIFARYSMLCISISSD